MNDELFEELMESVAEGAAILRGEVAPAKTFYTDASSIRKIRNQYDLSQVKFASILRISVDTLRNWEQGRRKPEGPAQVLLKIAAEHPEAMGLKERAVAS